MDFQQAAWRNSLERPYLRDDEIHVWRARLDKEPCAIRTLFETLSDEEKTKADKFRFAEDRNHFVTARGILRKILGNYLGISPVRLRFSYERCGKPVLNIEAGDNSLCFNLSHSRRFALFAVARRREIGIDLEFIDEKHALMKVAEMFFSAAEITMLKAIPADSRAAAFFSVWTRKEAFLKAIGKGLSYPPTQVTVATATEGREICSVAGDLHKTRRWFVMTLPFDHYYKAALAAEGTIRTVRFWQSPENWFE
jgi:4'-phosphopantetheinyl transferase